MMDEEDDEDDEEEDIEEEELDISGELLDPDPWDMYGELDVEDQDETTENTALLRAAAKTEIIVTLISPVSSAFDLSRMDSGEEYRRQPRQLTMATTTTNGATTNNNGDGDDRLQLTSSDAAAASTSTSSGVPVPMDSLKPEMPLQQQQQQQQQQHKRIASEDI
ncbi:hypothetical protein pipiens_015190 [Culex pipiens pipiens]|uniref:Uncharacterized protein n=1 Tax=Culex pipiens pipiens TaxID=38569 RepID=A0ABD1CRH9_CULPP